MNKKPSIEQMREELTQYEIEEVFNSKDSQSMLIYLKDRVLYNDRENYIKSRVRLTDEGEIYPERNRMGNHWERETKIVEETEDTNNGVVQRFYDGYAEPEEEYDTLLNSLAMRGNARIDPIKGWPSEDAIIEYFKEESQENIEDLWLRTFDVYEGYRWKYRGEEDAAN